MGFNSAFKGLTHYVRSSSTRSRYSELQSELPTE